MTALDFRVDRVRIEPFAAVPTLVFDLVIDERTGVRIQSVSLRCQIRIEPARRTYDVRESAQVRELFGEPTRWGDTQQPFLWTHASVMVPGFTGTITVPLFVECSYELEVAGARYLHALRDGAVPLLLLFSGTVFTPSAGGGISVEQIPWDREARFALPVRRWRELMDAYYPGGGWLRLSRETLDELGAFKAGHAIPTWDGAIGALMGLAARAEELDEDVDTW